MLSKMLSKLRGCGLVFSLVGVVLAFGNAHALEVEPDAGWMAGGWWQWHPHMGEYMLGKSGTQLYFAPGDPVEAVAEVAPPVREHTTPATVSAAVVPPAQPLDSDGDGIPDDRDKCPGTPRGAVVDASGCDPDPDGDGVRREDDLCPNTPAGVVVNQQGCWIIGKILFRYNDAHVQKKFKKEMKKVAEALGKYPAMKVEIQGHADSAGTNEYNDKLSLRRATSVKKSLLALGLSSERLSTAGFGEARPLNDNKTAKKRALNRRVEIISRE